jgi:hypothetical protein
MSAMRTGVLLCLLLAEIALCTQPAAPPESADIGRAKKDSAAFHVASQPDLAHLGLPAKYPATYFRDTALSRPVVPPVAGPESILGLVSRTWVSGPQQFLARLLPGTKFYQLARGIPAQNDFWMSFADGQAFDLAQMNGILAHAGISFDSSTVDVSAKLAVLLAYCGQRPITEPESVSSRELRRVLAFEGPDSLAFPSIDFRSFEHGPWRSRGGGTELYGVWVDCVIDGSVRRPFVAFRRASSGKLVPEFMASPDVNVPFSRHVGGGTRTEVHGALGVSDSGAGHS